MSVAHDRALQGHLHSLSVVGRSSVLYFIQDGQDGPIKIGFSDDPGARLVALQVGNPRELRLIASLDVADGPRAEVAWHYVFERIRIRGEWFAPDPRLLDQIDKAVRGEHGDMEPL